jgi:PAS domain S-box-containing protein
VTANETGAPIRALLVDDDPDWLRFTARTLEGERERLSVTTAQGASEGKAALGERDDIDCVISDYRMPGTDGLAFLEWVRSRDPELPFVLISGRGSEDVASEATAAGVTAYMVKDPGRDQAAALARCVVNAVERDRLRRRVAESEERYRTLVEQSRDAVFISRGGEVVFANPRAAELAGYGRPLDASWSDFLDDGDALAALERDAGETDFEAELRTRGGERRTGSFRASAITYEGEAATLCTVRDVTERTERERQLRTERDVKSAFRDVLVSASTREEIEAAVCREFVATDYALAWVAESDGGRLRPRTWAGGADGYLDAVGTDPESGEEPALRAARSGEAVFVDDIEDSPAPWREAALESGFRAAAALPLVYEGLPYGVLSVYASEPGIDAGQRELLGEVAEALAYSIESVGKTAALTAERVTEVTLDVRGDHPLAGLTAGGPLADGELLVRGTVPDAEGATLFLTAAGAPADALARRLAGRERVTEAAADGADRLRVGLTGPTVAGVVGELGGAVSRLRFADGAAEVAFDLPPERDVRAVVEALRERFGEVSVRSVTAGERTEEPDRLREGLDDLTDKQAEALRTAYHAGYFEQPRRTNADGVADALGVSRSTFIQHLRSAERKAFAALFGRGR